MVNPVISAENISKRYLVERQLGQRQRHDTLRDLIGFKVRKFTRQASELVRGGNVVEADEAEEFWALRDVSFTVGPGDVLAIVGRNGSGKSTILKILSRITEPTSGRVEIRGRLGSLIEIGTGFHPELTGRENVFLGGALLGMNQHDVRSRFDEIVAFAEVQRFLETPIKRYSSGMYIRLAFAVAAHLEPEILLIDEVLAVGDAAFQKKCLEKVQSIASEGRTVILVSHSTTALATLCKRGILLKNGNVVADGDIKDVLDQYTALSEVFGDDVSKRKAITPSITAVSMDLEALTAGDLVVDIGFVAPLPMQAVIVSFAINTSFGVPVFGSRFSSPEPNSRLIRFVIRQIPLAGGFYTVSVKLGDGHQVYDYRWDVVSFEIRSSPSSTVTVGHMEWPVEWQSI